MNLLSNAVKFTQEGTITVTAWLAEPRAFKPTRILNTDKSDNAIHTMHEEREEGSKNSALFISVKDTGVGIPKEE